MGAFLGVTGFLGFIVCVVLVLASAIKHEPIERKLEALVFFLILFFVSLFGHPIIGLIIAALIWLFLYGATVEQTNTQSRNAQNDKQNNRRDNKKSTKQWRKKKRNIPRYNANEDLRKADAMDGHTFEYWCADLLRDCDFTNVSVTQASNDQGVDVIAWKGGKKYAIQCKRYANKLSNTPIQEVYTGKAVYGCDIAVVMTNNYFTDGAVTSANATGVLLWDRQKLREMLENRRWYLYEDMDLWPHNRGSREINFDYYNSFPPVPLLQGMKSYIQCSPLGGPAEKWNPYVLYDKDPETHYMIEIVSENFSSAWEAEHFLKAITKRYYALSPYGVDRNGSYFVSAYIHGEYIRDKFDYDDACFYLENWAE